MDKLEKINRKMAVIQGMQDEAMAKVNLLRHINRQKPHKREEVKARMGRIQKDLTRYKRLREKVKLELEEIENGFNEFS